ncbi:MAG TPA: BACON domain-containing carbohydrate-binding protein [Thermoanaerobaculia bacterium]|nr:BACON domain-containing carbohydrate-binding protein [Thermoanaerobaculia bacterium]
MRRLALSLVLLSLVLPAAASRRRTAHHPAPTCSFSLAPAWGNSPIAAGGATRALVLVFGQTQECSQWAAYSPVDWVTVEAAPLAGQPSAFVGVTANPSAQPRSTTIVIAGIRLNITQEGAATISPPIAGNLLANGTFDKDTSAWGWPRPDYPNGPGSPIWSQLDANGSVASGSMLLRDIDFVPSQSFQQLQCVRIPTGGGFYQYGATVRVGSTAGEAALGFLYFASTDCSGNYLGVNGRVVHNLGPQEVGVWKKVEFSRPMPGTARSAMLVLASGADTPTFEVWFDDVFIREVK